MKRRGFLTLATGLALGVALSIGGCDRRPAAGGSGAPRIAVLSPALAATLKDLGCEQAIVGRHAWDLVLDRSVPVVGDGVGEVDFERLAELKPTLVVGQFGMSGMSDRLVSMGRSRGWTIRGYDPLSLGDVMDVARKLAADAEAAGCVGVGERLAAVERELAESLAPRPGAASAGRVLILADAAPLAALGPGSVHHEILIKLGGTPAITEGKPFITMDGEDLAKLAPDAILLISPRNRGDAARDPSAAELIAGFGRAGSLDIPAFRNGRVAFIDDPLTHLTATTIRGTAAAMGDRLGKWAEKK